MKSSACPRPSWSSSMASVVPGGEVPTQPLPGEGDLCEEGTFTDHPQGAFQGDSMLEQLDEHLRNNHRTREPEEQTVPL